jgi:hypothetical protein
MSDMPTYIRPARVDITESGGRGGLVLIAAGVAFIAAHIVLLAVCAAVFTAVMGSVAAWFRWAASPQRLRAHYHPRPTVRVLPANPSQPLSAPQARAIEAPRRQLSARAARLVTIHVRRPR